MTIPRCRHNRIFCVYCGHVGTRSSPAASAEWVVCGLCRNVIEPHHCEFGRNRQPWQHGTGTNWGYQCPSSNHRQFNDRPCAYCGHTIRTSPAASAAPTQLEGGEIIMEITITIDGVEYKATGPEAAVAAAPAELHINRTWVVYDVNGNRVDGYKFESRARRNNDRRFAGVGYWLGRANSADFTFVQA